MTRDSTSLKKSSGDCLKLAKQRYSILSEMNKMMLFRNYCIFSGSAEALVRCGGGKHPLIAYFLGNTCAKYYENPTMLSTAKYVGDVFLRHTVLITNRKSHTVFRMVPISVTLKDLERHNSPYYFALFHRI